MMLITGNENVSDLKLKKAIKGHQRKTRLTLYEDKRRALMVTKKPFPKEHIKITGIYLLQKRLDYLGPLISGLFSVLLNLMRRNTMRIKKITGILQLHGIP